jgi:2-polyprenyl-6-methoxyphenol hydroxylase-like FAD-dependent oxidoreductase
MARVLFVGGGIVGMTAAVMLARDGHDVTVLERDPQPPPPPLAAWERWDRRGVNQFRQLHFLLPRFREVADAELPGLTDGLGDAGGLRFNLIDSIPTENTGGRRSGDDNFDVVTCRRPVSESVIAAMAESTPGLTVLRGVSITGLIGEPGPAGVARVTGVHSADGTRYDADLVIDAGGRRSAMPSFVRAIGGTAPIETVEDCGFLYYGRHFRSTDGSVPVILGPLLQPYGSVSLLTLPADNGTWGIGVITSAKDTALRPLRQSEVWERTVKAFPLIAHWTDGEPIDDVKVIAKIEDRRRHYVVDGVPVVAGLLALGDAWACTNPSLGRGIAIGVVHAAALRAMIRDHPLDDPIAVACNWAQRTSDGVDALVTETFNFDRHRLAQIDAEIAGTSYETDDPAWRLGQALSSAATHDPDLLRGQLEIASLLSTGADVFARPGFADRATALADPTPLPGPDRAELLALLAG